MTVYKVQKRLIYLLGLLLLASLFFSYSVYVTEFSGGAMAVCFVLIVLLGFNLAVLISKTFTVEEGIIRQTTLYGKKVINVQDIEEIGVVKLRWRIILILSDPHKFVFISSLYGGFEEFINYLKDELREDVIGNLRKVTPEKINRKNLFLMLMMVLGTLFFLLGGTYNIIYR